MLAIVLADETCPAEAFLEALDANGQTGFKARLEALAAQGYLRSPEYMRLLDAGDPKTGERKVWEIKVDKGPGLRLYVVREGKDWIATHGGQKPSKRGVAKEVARARSLMTGWKKS